MIRVFLDASTLLAAAGSLSGGSAATIDVLLGSEDYEAVTSRDVETEAFRHVGAKFKEPAGLRLRSLLGELMPLRVDPSSAPLPPDLPASVAAKDHHVIAACIAAEVAICLTLDRRHLLSAEVRAWGLRHGIHFLTPGEFLAWNRRRADENP